MMKVKSILMSMAASLLIPATMLAADNPCPAANFSCQCYNAQNFAYCSVGSWGGRTTTDGCQGNGDLAKALSFIKYDSSNGHCSYRGAFALTGAGTQILLARR